MSERLVGGRYRLGSRIGVGGMGRVWRARDEVLRREVAVKEVLLPEAPSEDEAYELRQRTLREAQTAARLSHPNVVRIYDVIDADDRPWIVMEYVSSRSLAQVIKEDGPMRPDQVAVVGIAVLDALCAAHEAGVLHRDVKPGNVLLADDGRVVLTDFGLATFDEIGSALTQSGVVHGSPQFIAPERALDGTSSVEADMWSLGATLYAAVEGQSPYARATSYQTLAALATAPPDPPKRAGSMKPILAGLLRRKPSNRMKPTEVRARLVRVASGDAGRSRFAPRQRRPGSTDDGGPSEGVRLGPSTAVAPAAVPVAAGSDATPAAAGSDATPAAAASASSGGASTGGPAPTDARNTSAPADSSGPAAREQAPSPAKAVDALNVRPAVATGDGGIGGTAYSSPRSTGRHLREDPARDGVAGMGSAGMDAAAVGDEYRRTAPAIEWRHSDGGIVIVSSDTKEELAPPLRRRSGRWVAIAAAVAVLLAGGGYVTARQLGAPRPAAHAGRSTPGTTPTPSTTPPSTTPSAPGQVSPGVPTLPDVAFPCSQSQPSGAAPLPSVQAMYHNRGLLPSWTWFPFKTDFFVGLPVGWLIARSSSTACLYDPSGRVGIIGLDVSPPQPAQAGDASAVLLAYVASVRAAPSVSNLRMVDNVATASSVGPMTSASVSFTFNGTPGAMYTWARAYLAGGQAYLMSFTSSAASASLDYTIFQRLQGSVLIAQTK